MYHMEAWCGHFLTWWQTATLTDYAHLVLAVVLVGWFWTRLHSYSN